MRFSKLNELIKNEPKFRINQIQKLIFVDLIDDWSQASTLPKNLREKLNNGFPLAVNAKIFKSKKDGSEKALICFEDNLKAETVLLRHADGRNTVCVSSQIGCPLKCAFCATGKMGFKRNLAYEEIIEQVLFFARLLKKENKKITNIVFMGMGEPFLNYDNVMKAIKALHEPQGFNLGARHFSISTSGIMEGIKKLSQESLEINLAVSLHAANDRLRNKIMPINQKYPLKTLFIALNKYILKTNKRIMIEYLLIDKLNDSEKDANDLVKLLTHPLYFINLITYNKTENFRSTSPEKIERFKKILDKAKINYTQRHSFGSDVKGACGQLCVK